MGMLFRRAAIRVLLPPLWRPSPDRMADRLASFAAIEADSAWQFLHALDAVADPERRVDLFNNALEEVHHAALFERAARAYATRPPAVAPDERVPIYDPAQGLLPFLAYAYVGEKDVLDQFEAYHAAVGPGAAREAFQSAMGDEADHVELAMALLRELFGSEAAIRAQVRRIRRRRAWESWLRFSKRLGEFSTGLLLSVVYFAFGPLGVLSARGRMNRARRSPATRRPIPATHPREPAAPEAET